MTKPSWCAIKTIKSFLSKRKERKKHNQHCLPGVNPSYSPLSHEFVSSLSETYLSIFAWKLSERNPFKASFSHLLVDTLFCPLALLPFSYPGKTCQKLSKRLIWQGAWMYSSLYLWKYCTAGFKHVLLFYNRLCQPDVRSKISASVHSCCYIDTKVYTQAQAWVMIAVLWVVASACNFPSFCHWA